MTLNSINNMDSVYKTRPNEKPKNGLNITTGTGSKLNIKDPRKRRALLVSEYTRISNNPDGTKINNIYGLITELKIINQGGKKDKDKYNGMINNLENLITIIIGGDINSTINGTRDINGTGDINSIINDTKDKIFRILSF